MTTPERPSLADTLAHIDAALADDEGDRCEISHITRDNGGFSGSRCPNQALPGLCYCQPHTDRYGVSPKPGSSVDDEATAEVLRIVQDDFARHEREYLRGSVVTGIPIEHADWEYFGRVARQAAEPAPERGWLARALKRLGVW